MRKDNKWRVIETLLDLFGHNPVLYLILPDIVLIPLDVAVMHSHKTMLN